MKWTPALIGLVLVVLGAIPSAQGTSIKLIENTDRCIYQPGVDLDYCYSIYEVCDKTATDPEKISFVFRDTKTKISQAKDTWPGLTKQVEINASKLSDGDQCRRVKIEALKNPIIDLDNIPCYGGECWPEFAWWNTSYPWKVRVYGNVSANAANHTAIVATTIIDSGGPQILHCNATISPVNQTLFWVYWRNSTGFDGRCVNSRQTAAIPTHVEAGNGSDYGANIYDGLELTWHFNQTASQVDVTHNGLNSEVAPGDPALNHTGIVGPSVIFDGTGDYYNVSGLFSATVVTSISTWIKIFTFR